MDGFPRSMLITGRRESMFSLQAILFLHYFISSSPFVIKKKKNEISLMNLRHCSLGNSHLGIDI